MYKLYTRHAFEHMLYQYMHSHYLMVESKEDDDGSKTRNKMLGERQRLKIPESLKPGVYYVRDTSENQKYEVTVRCKFFIFQISKSFF